ncbi:D-glycero-alpha-D-manno-heptose-1,7-bisphosphate 7-phosphatase [Limnofasciculus baicalensis]|uniref:D,D-heptose 1,7-bisphosphate phosphatase n=1 Tax=Limnofasciculus baicalensis BBK-W-15 TaxID=2699891 RepID=A0AAE3KML8_9CYAN|nr:HAD family hydrolase [Limnofasciculus baicalensis]MCP2727783.1 HAD family hydrolase [Limnofasciculus baicalensis BBK-W-15]
MSNLKPAVFLDRDGVVNKVVFRNGKPASPRSLDEFIWGEGITEAVKRLKAACFYVFVVTNQPDIARKKLDAIILAQISETIRQSLPIDDLLVCPHDDSDRCACRKPKSGMLISLAAQWQIDLNRSFMVGDSWKDMAAGTEAGCQTILIERPYNRDTVADFQALSVLEATDIILNLIDKGDKYNELHHRVFSGSKIDY